MFSHFVNQNQPSFYFWLGQSLSNVGSSKKHDTHDQKNSRIRELLDFKVDMVTLPADIVFSRKTFEWPNDVDWEDMRFPESCK